MPKSSKTTATADEKRMSFLSNKNMFLVAIVATIVYYIFAPELDIFGAAALADLPKVCFSKLALPS